MTYGYIKTEGLSNKDYRQQIQTLRKEGVDKLFSDCLCDDKSVQRKHIKEVLKEMRAGDRLVFDRGSRVANSIQGLKDRMCTYLNAGIAIYFIKEDLLIDAENLTAYLKFMNFISQVDADLMAKKSAAHLEAARKAGKTGGRPPIDNEKIEKALSLYASSNSVRSASQLSGVSVATIYRALRKKNKRAHP